MGEAPRGRPTHLFPLLCRVAAGEASELIVHGDDWDTADGTGVRDYIHVQDLADGFVRALRYVLAKPGMLTVNLGSGEGDVGAGRDRSVRARVRALDPADHRTAPARRCGGQLRRQCAAAALLDWRPTRDLDAICADAWRWQKNGGR